MVQLPDGIVLDLLDRIHVEEVSSKVRCGPLLDNERDYGLPVWAGVVPLEVRSWAPIPDDRLLDGVALPDYVRH